MQTKCRQGLLTPSDEIVKSGSWVPFVLDGFLRRVVIALAATSIFIAIRVMNATALVGGRRSSRNASSYP
jgi:hypothetical protein